MSFTDWQTQARHQGGVRGGGERKQEEKVQQTSERACEPSPVTRSRMPSITALTTSSVESAAWAESANKVAHAVNMPVVRGNKPERRTVLHEYTPHTHRETYTRTSDCTCNTRLEWVHNCTRPMMIGFWWRLACQLLNDDDTAPLQRGHYVHTVITCLSWRMACDELHSG